MRLKIVNFLLILSMLLNAACVDLESDEEKRFEQQQATIQKYVTDKGLNAQKDASGVFFVNTQEGTGKALRVDSAETVVFKYRGYLLDGSEFATTEAGKLDTVPLRILLPGLQLAFSKMKKGGKATVIIPSDLAFGSNTSQGLPANSIVAFDLELVDFGTQAYFEEANILKYLANNSLTATKHSSGIHYIILEAGTGENPNATSIVTVKYKGYLLNKKVFDETKNNASVQFPLSGVIEGWKIAVPLLKKGGKGIFWIPSRLGYGPNGNASIPGNSVLIFEIELVSF
jgi:FKBP-type peptidyl-prolyl cis-trans isomerase